LIQCSADNTAGPRPRPPVPEDATLPYLQLAERPTMPHAGRQKTLGPVGRAPGGEAGRRDGNGNLGERAQMQAGTHRITHE
jgi:hypothetical protein